MAPVATSLPNTFGALYVGLLVSTALWGMTTVQVYIYLKKFPKDIGVLKLMVFLVWILDTVGQAFISHALWYYLIDNFSNSIALQFSTWTIDAIVVTNSILACIVQLYFGFRMHRISRGNYLLSGSIIASALASCGLGCTIGARAAMLQAFVLVYETTNLVSANVACALLCDLLISGGLSYYLHRAKTGFQKSDSTIDRLLITTVNRGIITCAFVTVELICFLEMPNNLVYLGLHFIAGKLYVNSWLGALNARRAIQGKADHTEDDTESDHISSFSKLNQPSYLNRRARTPVAPLRKAPPARTPTPTPPQPPPRAPPKPPIIYISPQGSTNATRTTMSHPFGPRGGIRSIIQDGSDSSSANDSAGVMWSAR